MKVWKVILAALVIFAAGMVTGGFTVQLTTSKAKPSESAIAGMSRQRGDLLDRMQRQLYLTPAQRENIEQILRDSNSRMRELWKSIAPRAQEEHGRVRDLIRDELRPEQRAIFEEMLKSRRTNRSREERGRRDEKPARKPDHADQTPAAKEVP